MAAETVARKVRRGRKSAVKLGLLGTAAVTAATMAVTSAPPASAAPLNIEQQVLTAGPLLDLLPALGITSIGPLDLGPIPIVAPDGAFLTLTLSPIAYDTQSIYNDINALPFKRRTGLLAPQVFDRTYSVPGGPAAGQFPAVLSSGIGSGNAVQAYRTQISSVRDGVTPGGYTPFQPGAGNLPNQTNQVLLLLRNPYRPNGGIQARFAPVLNLFGVDTSMPAAGKYQSSDDKIRLNTATIDLTWAYDPIADFPATLNPFSLLNSLFAGLPTNLLGDVSLQGISNQDGPSDTGALGLNVADVLGIINRIVGAPDIATGKRWYGTLLPNDLPLLEPLRLPARILNEVFGLELGTPLADALQPALTILVNTGYTDVVTPTDGGLYTRTFLTSNTPEPFLSKAPLTPAEWLQVPGDVLRALVVGFQDSFPILRFGQTAPVLTVDGNHLAITYPPPPPPVSAVRPAAETELTAVVAPEPVALAAVSDEPAAEPAVSDEPVTPRAAVDVPAPPPVVATADADAPAPVVSPRRARGSAAPANNEAAQAPASSEATQSRAGAARQSDRQGVDAPATRRAARSAAN